MKKNSAEKTEETKTQNNTQPFYQKIRQDILEKIQIGELMPGDRLPTEAEFMKQYEVSRITVSKALTKLKRDGFIVRHPNRGSFVAEVPELPARPVKTEKKEEEKITGNIAEEEEKKITEIKENTNKNKTEIACIFPSIRDLFSLSMVNGVVSVFPVENYLCHIFQSQNAQNEEALLSYCLEKPISGIVLFPHNQLFLGDSLLKMKKKNYPLVLLDRYLPDFDTSYVIADNKMAGELCICHLHDLGHQRFCFVTTTRKETYPIKLRLEGIMDAAKRLQISKEAVYLQENFDVTQNYYYHRNLFLKLIFQERVSAFITAESDACSYMYELFSFMGIKIPDQISLISFDRPISGSVPPDFFTCVDQSEYQMGREAGLILKNRLKNYDRKIYHKMIEPRLRLRGSAGRILL